MKRLSIVDKLDNDLKESQRELQVEIPQAILTAREHGDLSENAEYKAAKERQMFLQSRVLFPLMYHGSLIVRLLLIFQSLMLLLLMCYFVPFYMPVNNMLVHFLTVHQQTA